MTPAAKTFIAESSLPCPHNTKFYEPRVDCGEYIGEMFDRLCAEAISRAVGAANADLSAAWSALGSGAVQDFSITLADAIKALRESRDAWKARVEAAKAEEREACAQVVEACYSCTCGPEYLGRGLVSSDCFRCNPLDEAAAQIRARGVHEASKVFDDYSLEDKAMLEEEAPKDPSPAGDFDMLASLKEAMAKDPSPEPAPRVTINWCPTVIEDPQHGHAFECRRSLPCPDHPKPALSHPFVICPDDCPEFLRTKRREDACHDFRHSPDGRMCLKPATDHPSSVSPEAGE